MDNYLVNDLKILWKFEINPTGGSRDMSNQISSKTEKVKKVHCNFKKVTDSKQLIKSEAIKWFEAMISKITFLVQSGKYEFFELILQCYILETLSLSQYLTISSGFQGLEYHGIHPTAVKICAEFNLLNPKIYYFFLCLFLLL